MSARVAAGAVDRLADLAECVSDKGIELVRPVQSNDRAEVLYRVDVSLKWARERPRCMRPEEIFELNVESYRRRSAVEKRGRGRPPTRATTKTSKPRPQNRRLPTTYSRRTEPPTTGTIGRNCHDIIFSSRLTRYMLHVRASPTATTSTKCSAVGTRTVPRVALDRPPDDGLTDLLKSGFLLRGAFGWTAAENAALLLAQRR